MTRVEEFAAEVIETQRQRYKRAALVAIVSDRNGWSDELDLKQLAEACGGLANALLQEDANATG